MFRAPYGREVLAPADGFVLRLRDGVMDHPPHAPPEQRSIETQAAPNAPESVKQGFEGLVALKRYGTNEEIAKLALFLASDDSSYCTGGVFVADGGFTAT